MFGRARSKAELQQLKDDYYANLQVEIENASVLERKIRKPDEAPPVPPQYKTDEELMKDIFTLRNELIDMLINEFGYGYSTANQAIEGLDSDEIIKLVALFPSFKLTLAKDATRNRLRILPPEFINSAMKNFIKKTGRSFGAEYSVGIPSSLGELKKMLPSSDSVRRLKDFLSSTDVDGVSIPDLINETNPDTLKTIITYLDKYVEAYPTLSQLKELEVNIPPSSRGDLARELGQAMIDYKLLTDDDVSDIEKIVRETIKYREPNDIAQLGQIISSRLGGAYDSQIEQFKRVWDTALKTKGGKNMARLKDIGEMVEVDVNKLPIEEAIDILFKESGTSRGGKRGTRKSRNEEEEEEEETATNVSIPNVSIIISEIVNNTDDEDSKRLAIDLINDSVLNGELVRTAVRNTFLAQGINNSNDIDNKVQAENVIEAIHREVKDELKKLGIDEGEQEMLSNISNISIFDSNQEVRAIARQRIEDRFNNKNKSIKNAVSLSTIDRYLDTIKNKIKEVYGVDVDFPKYSGRKGVLPSKSEPVAALNGVINMLIDEKNYDPDAKLLLPDEKILGKTLEGFGAKNKKDRISVKKLVGRGIDVEQQPTYKKFGKYVMHYPHLVNNNVFNVKYPSLGSIPAIKPKTITDEYKEFVLDIFDSGKMNERLFNTLDDDEKTHFHKVCKGAGLLELFKLRKGDTDEEKDDLDRFNLLKGSFVAGNNSESVVRELRSLITKFIHESRITKNEGLSLLMEIK